MDNFGGGRSLSGEEVISFNVLNITGDLEVNDNPGSALQVLSKNSFNKLVWASSTTHDDAGVGLLYNATTDKIDLNLNGLPLTTTLTQNDFMVFHSNASGLDTKILNSNYIDPTLCDFFRTVVSIGDTATDQATNHMWIQQIDGDGNRTLTKVLIETFVDFVLSKFTTHGTAITFNNTVIIKPTLDAMYFLVEDNSSNVAFQLSSGPFGSARKVNMGNSILDTNILGNELKIGSDNLRLLSHTEFNAVSPDEYFKYLNDDFTLKLGNQYVSTKILSNLDGASAKGKVTFVDVKDSIFKLNHIHEVSGAAASNENLLLINAGSLPYFKIFTEGGDHDLVVIDIHGRVSNFNLEYKPPSLAPDTDLKSRDFFKINHKNDEDTGNYGQIEMLFTLFNLGTQTIDTAGGFKFDNNFKKIQFLNMFNQPGLEYLSTSHILRFDAPIDSDIIPNISSTYDLGSASKEWKVLYCDSVVGANVLSNPLGASFLPDTNLTYDLGSSEKRWNNIHVGQLITTTVNSNLIPDTNDTHVIGEIGKVYTEIHGKTIRASEGATGLGGTLSGTNLSVAKIGVYGSNFTDRIILDSTTGLEKILPETNDVIELGSIAQKFKTVQTVELNSDNTISKNINFNNDAGTTAIKWDGTTELFTGFNSSGEKAFEFDYSNQSFNFYHDHTVGGVTTREKNIEFYTNRNSTQSPIKFTRLPQSPTGLSEGELYVNINYFLKIKDGS